MNNVSQLLMVGVPGKRMTSPLRNFLSSSDVMGVILFSRNYEDPRQLCDFVDALHDTAGRQLIIAVDQEGGRVMRFRDGFTSIPPMSHVGLIDGHGDLARKLGELIARELSAVGINLDFAPVMDVNTNKKNPVIGDRAFSSDVETVSRLGSEFIRGMESLFVGACAKHFPGHGDTDLDSHESLPVIEHDRDRLDACEFLPFKAAIDAGVSSIMTAHILNRNLDGRYPATVSEGTLTGLLRRELAFEGMIFTDDLTMKGLSDLYPPHKSACMAIKAGADVALVCTDDLKVHERVIDEMSRAADKNNLDATRIGDALSRIDAFRERFIKGTARPSLDVLSCKEHHQFMTAFPTV